MKNQDQLQELVKALERADPNAPVAVALENIPLRSPISYVPQSEIQAIQKELSEAFRGGLESTPKK